MKGLTLAELKRRLHVGAKIQIVKHDWCDRPNWPLPRREAFYEVRSVITSHATEVQFSDGSWLKLPKASCIRGTDTGFEVCLNGDASFREVISYEWRN